MTILEWILVGYIVGIVALDAYINFYGLEEKESYNRTVSDTKWNTNRKGE